MSLSNYQALDLKKGGEKAAKLFEHIDNECGPGILRLTGDGDAGSASANLTPAMNTWLNSEIIPTRAAALNAIQMEAAQIVLSGSVPGIVPEIEADKLKRRRNERRAQVNAGFYDTHKRDLDDLAEAESEYLVMKTYEGGREARTPSKLLDALVIIGILIPELFMNYRYFFDSIQLGSVALGSAIVAGLGFGFSAYMAGRFWKAFHFYMRPDDPQQRQKGLRMISIAASLLLVSLFAVGAVRYFGVIRQAEEFLALGQVPPNPLLQTSFLLFGNLLVFALGLAVTYLLHDENPLYAEKAEKYEKQKKLVDRIRKKELVDKLTEIDQAYQQDAQKMTARANLMNSKPGYAELREKIGYLMAKDNEVVAMLQDYRGKLCGKLPADKVIVKETGQTIDVPDFAKLGIELYRC